MIPETMHSIGGTTPDPVMSATHRRLSQQVHKVVGSVFFGAMLQELRDSSIKGAYGHGGWGEKVFQGQMHQVLAERAGEGRSYDFANAIVRHLMDQQERLDRAREAEQMPRSDKA